MEPDEVLVAEVELVDEVFLFVAGIGCYGFVRCTIVCAATTGAGSGLVSPGLDARIVVPVIGLSLSRVSQGRIGRLELRLGRSEEFLVSPPLLFKVVETHQLELGRRLSVGNISVGMLQLR